MKKLIIVLIIIIFFRIDILHSQVIKSYGAKLGLTYSKYDWIPQYVPAQVVPDIRHLSSMNFAVYGEFFACSYLSVVSQLEYSQKGANIVYTDLSQNDIYYNSTYETFVEDNLTYLSLPIFLKIKASQSFISPYLLVGPRVDYLLNKKIENIGYGPIFNHFKKFVFGSSIGFGLQTVSIFNIEARYNIDITNSFHDGGIELRNNSFDLWIGVGF